MPNHWSDSDTLIVEEKTMFRQVGWRGQSGEFYQRAEEPGSSHEPGGFAPVYEQVSTWVDGEGWHD